MGFWILDLRVAWLRANARRSASWVLRSFDGLGSDFRTKDGRRLQVETLNPKP